MKQTTSCSDTCCVLISGFIAVVITIVFINVIISGYLQPFKSSDLSSAMSIVGLDGNGQTIPGMSSYCSTILDCARLQCNIWRVDDAVVILKSPGNMTLSQCDALGRSKSYIEFVGWAFVCIITTSLFANFMSCYSMCRDSKEVKQHGNHHTKDFVEHTELVEYESSSEGSTKSF